MSKVKSRVSKGKRFDIFKRDSFTCQYCGRQPPEVILHVDHIIPVVEGGTNDPMNLITSCRDCNLGKGRKILEQPQRPDADLAWLEMQQEYAELKAYQAGKQERDRVMLEIIETLQDTWLDHSGLSWRPSTMVLRKMLSRYSPEVVEESLIAVALKVGGGYLSKQDWQRYTWAVLRNKAEGR